MFLQYETELWFVIEKKHNEIYQGAYFTPIPVKL